MTINEQIESFLLHEGVTENELIHYGVKGMRWGVRRAASRVRAASAKRKGTPSEEHINARINQKKGRHQLTNKELRDTIERLNLEQQYDRLSPSAKSKAKQTTAKVLGQVGQTVVNTAIQTGVKVGTNALLDAAGLDAKGRKKE